MIREETSKRICNHMNKDHMDAIHGYLKNYTDVKAVSYTHLRAHET